MIASKLAATLLLLSNPAQCCWQGAEQDRKQRLQTSAAACDAAQALYKHSSQQDQIHVHRLTGLVEVPSDFICPLAAWAQHGQLACMHAATSWPGQLLARLHGAVQSCPGCLKAALYLCQPKGISTAAGPSACRPDLELLPGMQAAQLLCSSCLWLDTWLQCRVCPYGLFPSSHPTWS